jgi:acyl-CoA reductase-like NAD-dependent aldehyde dehydrogenase
MPTMAIANEKAFDPVPSLMPYADDRAEVAIANGTSYGLSAGFWSTDEVNLFFTQIPVKQYRCSGSVQKH